MKPWHLVLLLIVGAVGAFGGWVVVAFLKGRRDG
jgi:hypothetical protein